MGRSSGWGVAQLLTGWIQLSVSLGYVSLFLLLWSTLMKDGIQIILKNQKDYHSEKDGDGTLPRV